MSQIPTILVDISKGVVISVNDAAKLFLSCEPSGVLADHSIDALPVGFGFRETAGRRPRWIRQVNGKRRWLWPVTAPLPDKADNVLILLEEAPLSTLETEAIEEFTAILNDLEGNVPLSRTLSSLCDVMVRTLDLPLARVLSGSEAELNEIAFGGDRHLAEAVRGLATFADSMAPAIGVSSKAFRTRSPVVASIDPHGSDWNIQLLKHGVRSAAAWPLRDLDARLVLELVAFGAEDLTDSPTSDFLNKWIPWLNDQFARRVQVKQQRLIAEALTSASTPVFITDNHGVITWVNQGFSTQYGYKSIDAVGRTPRILQSGAHGQRYYEGLWSAITSGHAWSGRTVDRAANGRLLTVRQCVSPVRHSGNVTHFLAIHCDITDEAELASLSERQRGIDDLTGLMTVAAFEERCREILATAAFKGLKPAFMLISVRTRMGEAPVLDPDTLAFVYAELGERIRNLMPEDAVGGNLTGLDFAALLSSSSTAVDDLARQLVEMIQSPIPLLGDSLELVCKTAVATFPEDGGTVNDLRKTADHRLAEIGR